MARGSSSEGVRSQLNLREKDGLPKEGNTLSNCNILPISNMQGGKDNCVSKDSPYTSCNDSLLHISTSIIRKKTKRSTIKNIIGSTMNLPNDDELSVTDIKFYEGMPSGINY